MFVCLIYGKNSINPAIVSLSYTYHPVLWVSSVYPKLEVDPPKLHARKNGLRITINQITCSCALRILLTKLVGCVREPFVSTELLTA